MNTLVDNKLNFYANKRHICNSKKKKKKFLIFGRRMLRALLVMVGECFPGDTDPLADAEDRTTTREISQGMLELGSVKTDYS